MAAITDSSTYSGWLIKKFDEKIVNNQSQEILEEATFYRNAATVFGICGAIAVPALPYIILTYVAPLSLLSHFTRNVLFSTVGFCAVAAFENYHITRCADIIIEETKRRTARIENVVPQAALWTDDLQKEVDHTMFVKWFLKRPSP